MRLGTFSGSLIVAAISALGSIPYLMVARPIFGSATAWSTCCVAITVCYLISIAPSLARGLRIGFLAGVFGLGIIVSSPSFSVTVLGCAILLGVLRSGFVFRAEPARALLIEGGLLAGGLALGNFLSGVGVLSLAMAIWGFFLVQSLYFLLGGVGRRVEREEGVDPFERAYEQAVGLMDDVSF